jgi:molybdate transport system substrate-binding protein
VKRPGARSRPAAAVVTLVALAIATPACAGRGASASDANGGSRTLTVLAAASLTEAFQRIGADFERLHPGATVRFSFGPSDGLAAQIQAGAPADVFASASPRWMDVVAADPGISDRADLTRNRLVIVTPADDPAGISSIGDLARPGVKLVLAAGGVPAGDYARRVLANAGIERAAMANVVSNEEDVKSVIQKVLLGEADAGIVYVTDVTSAVKAEIREVAIPDDVNVVATYPIAVVAGSGDAGLARELVRYATGSAGRATLSSFGFLPPGRGP